MSRSARLYPLIKGLSPAEQARFEALADKGSIYFKIYQEFRNADSETQLEKQLKTNGFNKNLGVYKHYLFDKVLDLISEDNGVAKKIARAEFLKERGFNDLALREFEDAEKQLEAEENFALLMEVYDRIFMLKSSSPMKRFNNRNDHKKYLEKRLELAELLQEHVNYQNLVGSALMLTSSIGVARNKQQEDEIQALLAHELLAEKKGMPKSVRAQLNYLQAKILLYKCMAKHKLSYEHCKQALSLAEKNPDITPPDSIGFLYYVYNYCSSALLNGDDSLCNECYAKMKAIRLKDEAEQAEQFLFIFNLGAVQHFNNGKYKDALKRIEKDLLPMLPKVEKHLEPFQLLINTALVSLCYLYEGDLINALKWNNRALEINSPNYRKDIYTDVRLLDLVIHYLLGNYVLVRNRIKGVIRLLKMNDHYGPLEETCIKMLRKLMGERTRRGEKEILEDYLKQFEDIGEGESNLIKMTRIIEQRLASM